MTGKERAAFRAQANTLKPVFQAGKEGVTQALITQTDEALTARELIKLRVLLETTPEPPKQIAQALADATGAQVIQVIGGTIVLYRYSAALHEKQRQKAENIRQAAKVKRLASYEKMKHRPRLGKNRREGRK